MMTFSKKFSRTCPNWELKNTHRRTASLRNWACHVHSLSSPYHLPAALNFRESKLPKQYERGRCLNDERAALRILSPIVGAGSKREQSGAWCENFHTKHAIIAALARGVYHDRLDTHTHIQLDSKARFHYSNQRRRRFSGRCRAARPFSIFALQKLVIEERTYSGNWN